MARSRIRSLGCLCLLLVVLAFGFLQLRALGRRNLERQRAAWRQKWFDDVKQGDSSAQVMDTRILPMLANDSDCRRIVTRLEFFEANISASDAKYVAQLQNVTSMTFYCTTGTMEVLLAARSLPITDITFEMPDLAVESYLLLKEFPHLKQVRFEHVMDDEWIARLRTELPNVNVHASALRSMQPRMAK